MDHQQYKADSDAESFWREVFSQHWLPVELNAPDSPITAVKPPMIITPVPSERLALIDRAAAERDVTRLQVIMAGALVVFLHLGDTDRLTLSAQLSDVTILPLTVELDPDASLYAAIDQLAAAIREAQSHQAFPFLRFATEKCGFSPVAQNLLTPLLLNMGEGVTSDAPLSIALHSGQSGVELVIQADEERFCERYLQGLGAAILTVLQSGLGQDKPISQIDLLTQDEIDRQLRHGTAPVTDYNEQSRVEAAFARQAADVPASLAVTHGEFSLTYAALDRASEQLFQLLRALGVQSGHIVAILSSRSLPMVVSSLAVLKSGAIYMPLDPDYPAGRIQLLLEESQAFVLIQSEGADHPCQSTHTPQWLDLPGGRVSVSLYNPHSRPLDSATAEQTACLMFTSGTTGRPKGVLNTHAGILRLVRRATYLDLPPGSRVAQAGATGFDASVFEIWAALLNGGCLQIVDREVLLDSIELADFFSRQKTDMALITTSLFSQLANDAPGLFAPLRLLFIGGDVISPKQVAAVYAACLGITIMNAYGPTENGVISTVQRIDPARLEAISIGQPISNSVALVLNRFGRLLPPQSEGELYVGGAGLALGYLKREQETANAFVAHPWQAGERLYRTGDRARWSSKGELEFLGRRDFQIKIRGFRVELSEIERVALASPLVNEAVVLALRPEGGSEYHLHCYLGVSDGFDSKAWHQSLSGKLPVHMIPSAVWAMPELPLTVNGKVDRNALSALKKKASGDGGARDRTERVLLEICRSLLDVDHLTTEDDLVRMGASSLTATIIASRLRRDLNVNIAVADILRCETVMRLAERVRNLQEQSPTAASISHSPAQTRVEATPQQNRLFIEQSRQVDACHYNLPLRVALPDEVDIARLQVTFQQLVLRHEILRTTFSREGDKTLQHIQANCLVSIAMLPETEDVDGVQADFVCPFDLQQGPLWRLAVCRAAGKSYLLFDIHHILTDGYSLFHLFGEWDALYNGQALSDYPLQYRDYANWLTSEGGQSYLTAQETYWLNMYTDKPSRSDLPVDYPRAGLRSLNGAFLEFELGESRSKGIYHLAASRQISVYTFLLACYGVFLARITGDDDITVGTPVAGRLAPGVDEIQGMFVNTLCLRLKPAASMRFDDFLWHVSGVTSHAFDNQDYPFDRLLERAGLNRAYDRSPLFDTMFALQNTGLNQRAFLGAPIVWAPASTGSAIYDLNLQVEEIESAFHACWHYNRDLFTSTTLASFRDQWLEIIDGALFDLDSQIQTLNRIKTSDPVVLPEINFNF